MKVPRQHHGGKEEVYIQVQNGVMLFQILQTMQRSMDTLNTRIGRLEGEAVYVSPQDTIIKDEIIGHSVEGSASASAYPKHQEKHAQVDL